jgi:4-amino-4-deoxy-L-arabinose transferase-like glycosyltransferase
MAPKNALTIPIAAHSRVRGQPIVMWRHAATAIALAFVLFFTLYHLTSFPITWFDEGSHLHVPKTLVRLGVYADYSSEGFRYYGPTVSVGPTVMLPIAGAFWLFGLGLLQARLIMAIYLLATLYVFYRLAHRLGGRRLAWVAAALLFTSRGPRLLEFGRQVLGEVPGLFFLVAGLWLWFATWERPSWRRLGLAGLLLGLAMISKNQYALVLAPTVALAWIVNMVYYRTAPHRTFIIPALVAGSCFVLWQFALILNMGSSIALDSLQTLRAQSLGAALVFSPSTIKQTINDLVSLDVYLGALVPALAYGLILALHRDRESQQWGTLLLLVAVNLGWYAFASVGWRRYAVPGLTISGLFVARLFFALTDGFQFEGQAMWEAWRGNQIALKQHALRWGAFLWLAAMLALPLAATASEILFPPFNQPQAMADYLNKYIPRDALIETWEPEMGFLTDHTYHFAEAQIVPPSDPDYGFVQRVRPDYVLDGPFAARINLYPDDLLAQQFRLVTCIGDYKLYAINS